MTVRHWHVCCPDSQPGKYPASILGTFITRGAAERCLARWQRRFPSSAARYFIDEEITDA